MSDSPRPHKGLFDLEKAFQNGDFDEVRWQLRELDAEGVELLEAQMGAGTVRQLRRLSRGTRAEKRGRVVVLHGIMGSNLDVTYGDGDIDRVWVNYWNLIWGGFRDLELKLDGTPSKNVTVQVAGQHKSYLPLTIGLSRRWHVLPFAYDWRQDIRKSSARLAQRIGQWAKGEPVHLVAHSMGGLVSRRLIHDARQLWNEMDDPSGENRGGRLVMLGTPNKGSFDIPLVLTGQEKLVKKLAKWEIGRRDSLNNILRVVGKFFGAYQMLPSHKVELQDDHQRLFLKRNWGHFPVQQKFLSEAKAFHEDLHAVRDADRMHYIAGYGQNTPYQIEIKRPGEFEIFTTREGDGRVPHILGLLEDVSTHWVRELHGDLPGNDRVIQAVDELLATGDTQVLPSARPTRRVRGAEEGERELWNDAEAEERLDTECEKLQSASKRTSKERGNREIQRRAAGAQQLMVESYLGTAGEIGEPGEGESVDKPSLRVRVVWTDIRECKTDVVCVGHYRGVMPQYAEWAVDQLVSPEPEEGKLGLLASLTERGVLIGELGEVQLYPWREHPERLAAVVGMGYPGTFSETSLRALARNLAWSLGQLPNVKTAATVLIGSGEGGLSTSVALRGLLEGVLDAFGEGLSDTNLQELQVVEYYVDRSDEIHAELLKLAETYRDRVTLDVGPLSTGSRGRVSDSHGLALALAGHATAADSSTAADRRAVDGILQWVSNAKGRRAAARRSLEELAQESRDLEVAQLAANLVIRPKPKQPGTEIPTRISFTRDDAKLRTAAITDTTVVRERVRGLNVALVRQLVESSTDPNRENLPDLARMLHRLLVPDDIKAALTARSSLVLEVDRFTAAVHWELMNPDPEQPGSERRHLGLDVMVSRQLRTEYSESRAQRPGVRSGIRRALVIGDPDGSLTGARWEAERVAELLRADGYDVTLLVGPNVAGGNPFQGDGASVFKVIHYLNKYPYDLLHYSGHGDFDREDPTRVGWVFHDGLLTAHELQTVPYVPRLVFANACLSGLLTEVDPRGYEVHDLRRDNAFVAESGGRILPPGSSKLRRYGLGGRG